MNFGTPLEPDSEQLEKKGIDLAAPFRTLWNWIVQKKDNGNTDNTEGEREYLGGDDR